MQWHHTEPSMLLLKPEILAHSLDKSFQAQLQIQKVLSSLERGLPSAGYLNKEKAQSYIGLDMEGLRSKKEQFKEM